MLAHLFEERQTCSLHTVRVVQGSVWRCALGGLPTLSVVLWCGWWGGRGEGVAPALFPAFAPSSSKVAVRFLVSLYLLSRIGPKCTRIQLFLAPIVSLYFVAGGNVCQGAGIAALQRKLPGPSLSHSPLRESTLSRLRSKELKVSPTTSSYWTRAI